MNQAEFPEEWSILLHAVTEESLTDEQERQLAELLRTDIAFRHEYARHCQLVTLLAWQLTKASEGPPRQIETAPKPESKPSGPLPRRSRATSMRSRRLWLSAALVIIVIGFVWLRPPLSGSVGPGEITEITGHVTVARGDQPPIVLRAEELLDNPWTLHPADQIQTERGATANVILRDRTEVRVYPSTQLSLITESNMRVSEGRIRALVTPQRSGASITFVTPQAEIRVLGTELEVLSLAGHTDVAVSEGRVRATRLSDGRSSEVGTAQFLSIADTGDLVVSEWPDAADEWSEDFNGGLPPGWTGSVLQNGLPEGSRGAAQSIAVPHAGRMSTQIGSPFHADGLFAWHDDSVLHVTFRVQPPAWFHIYLYARPYGDSQAVLTHCCVKPDLWQSSPGEWRTVSLPLSEFRLISSSSAEPTLGRIPNRIVFSGPSDSAGFAIDRIRVDRIRSNTNSDVP
jgi:ferric-dicitrate binding protein FerR (iron transport regulator)